MEENNTCKLRHPCQESSAQNIISIREQRQCVCYVYYIVSLSLTCVLYTFKLLRRFWIDGGL